MAAGRVDALYFLRKGGEGGAQMLSSSVLVLLTLRRYAELLFARDDLGALDFEGAG